MRVASVRRLLRWRLAALLAALALAVFAQAQTPGAARESAVKAAFLYKFPSFVEWPAGAFRSATDPLVIAVYGDEAVASELEQLAHGRLVEGRPVVVSRLRDTEPPSGVHVVFAGGGRESRARDLLSAVRGPVLTVADAAVGGRPGPVLYFTQQEGRVRFVASLTAATARNLRLSAKLLAVAHDVEGR